MRLKRYLVAALTLIVAFCGLGIDPALAAYNMPYYIDLDLTNQLVTVYNTKDDTIARQFLCSTGKNNGTPTGTWYLPRKTLDDERREWFYMKSYSTWVKYATRIEGAYFFHSIPFNSKSNRAMSAKAASDYGVPASHGCIRLRVEDAQFIAQNCLQGTRLRIFKSNQKNEDLRALLYVSTYSQDSGITYQEFMGISKDALGVGSTGSEVSELQLRLHDLGYYGDSINGEYRTSTVTAVKKLQKDLGLAQTGITTPALKEIIFSADAPVSADEVTIKDGSSGPVVRQFQMALQKLGIYDGDIDSVYDVDVIDAVKELQRLCGYSADGVATPEIQHLAYYEVNRLEKELGGEYMLEKISEEINMAKVSFQKSKVILRSQPNLRSAELTHLSYGDEVVVLAVKGDWAQLSVGSYVGFMYTRFLSPFVKENYVYKYTGSNGQTVTIGSTYEEMKSGSASNEQATFRNYYASAQYLEYLDESVEYVTVNTGSNRVKLNLRSTASSDGEILAELENGTNLRVLAKEDEWTRVGYDETIGYLMNQYLTFWEGTAADMEDTSTESNDSYTAEMNIRAVVISDKQNGLVKIYQKPDTSSKVLRSVGSDRQVRVLQVDEDTGWAYISYEDTKGFMQDKNLTFRLNG